MVALAAPLSACAEALNALALLEGALAVPEHARALLRARTRAELASAVAAAIAAKLEAAPSADRLLALLDTRRAGLAETEAEERRRGCPPNRIERLRRRHLALRLLEPLLSLFAVLLWVASVCAYLAGMPELAVAIVVVIVVNGITSSLQEYRAETAIAALEELLPHQVSVRRGGRERRIPASELVPGDVVQLDEGEQIPADGRLLEANDLRVDQSALSGESHPVFKLANTAPSHSRALPLERRERVFAGSVVVAGRAEMVVSAIGMATEIGRIAHLTQVVREVESPLQREMRRATRVVTALALGFGVFFFTLGIASGRMPLAQILVFTLGVIVANVPEGLLPTLTLALALGVQRLAREQSLIKRLSAVETLGATTVICTDKTGTLTENRMNARVAWCGGRTHALEGAEREPELESLLASAALASYATAEHGDPTEIALVIAAERLGLDVERLRRERVLLAPHPFDSFRKRMSLVRETPEGPVAYVKGAPRELLALCEYIVSAAGEDIPLDQPTRETILAAHDRLARAGYRLLGVARRTLPAELVHAASDAVERELRFVGFLALLDPPRADVAPALALCQRAGIRVIMITGDDPLTAEAIAREVGLPTGRVIRGEELERASLAELDLWLRSGPVHFARTSPAHKLAIVQALRRVGEIVAVTGDGVNDAPALKGADIGIAMGKRGSDVAREAADMVLADDRFGSIVTAVRLGRAVYANVGKFVTYIFASNVPELVPLLAAVLLGIPLPLTVMQILAVDLGTDLLPALALGTERPEPGLMDRPPRPRNERLLSRTRLLHAYGFLGAIEAALAMFAFFWTYWLAGWQPGLPLAAAGPLYVRATTMTLCGIVAAQIGNVFACRTDRESVFRTGLFSNRLVWVGIAAEIGLLLLLIHVPVLARTFSLAPLAFREWWILLLFPCIVLGLEEARKAWLRARTQR